MTITLYKSGSERNILNRSMTVVKSATAINATEVVNIETPDILINADPTLIGTDYAYIDNFSRYYFINSFEILNGNQYLLHLESDPLMSFKGGILSSPCIAKRSTSKINPDIEDNQAAFKNIPKRIHFKMANGFSPSSTGWCYILTLGGK